MGSAWKKIYITQMSKCDISTILQCPKCDVYCANLAGKSCTIIVTVRW